MRGSAERSAPSFVSSHKSPIMREGRGTSFATLRGVKSLGKLSARSRVNPEIKRHIVRWAPWVVVAGLLVFAAPPLFFTAAPVGCVSCHESRDLVSDVISGPHVDSEASCISCHVGSSITDRARFGFYQAYAMTLPILSTQGSAVSRVPDSSCTGCHSELPEISVSQGLRIQHAACGEGSQCTDCHSTVAHGEQIKWPNTYHMDLCLRCHETRQVSSSCETCHTGDLDRDRPTTGPWAITHGPNWQSTHGMGSMSTCGACHPEGYCTRCHGTGIPHDESFYDTHGRTSLAADARCEGCHTESFCSDCHSMEMPHPDTFAQEHGALVGEQGDQACGRCHAPEDCTGCHESHIHPGGAIPPGGVSQ